MALKFGYWATNESGGLVTTTIPQRTGSTFEDNKRYAQTAENLGFEYVLIATRYIPSYGAEEHYDSLAFASALATVTKKINLISAVLPGLWHPAVVAKIVSTIDHISQGRATINIVSGWFKREFQALGEPWLDHDERYRRSEEFIQVVKGLWTQEKVDFKGDFYRIHDAPLKPKPVQQPSPLIFQGGNSKVAQQMAARVSDFYFLNGNSLEELKKQIVAVKSLAEKEGRTLQFGVNGFVIVRDTEEEAQEVLREIIANADREVVEDFALQVKNAGKASPEGDGMWANSKFEDLIQCNDGFKTGLIGTPEQVANQIIRLKEVGIDLVLTGFLHYDNELKEFGENVIPLVRKKEQELAAGISVS